MASNMRRLAADHAALHRDKLPPYYLLPSDDGYFAAADDLMQLNVLITGPPGTPYAEGLWRLHLKMPKEYPNSPPKATFRTKIWHPNVDESTGAVCVDTLKKDWEPTLTLRDVLVTISCLLINPNPDSALNAAAGTLLREDYDGFIHQAKLMTSIHAAIQPAMKSAVKEAKYRGEDPESISVEEEELQDPRPRKLRRLQSSIPTRKVGRIAQRSRTTQHAVIEPAQPTLPENTDPDEPMVDSENEELDGSGKENDPSLSPIPVHPSAPSPRKNTTGKRALSVISTSFPDDSDADLMLVDSDSENEYPSTPKISASDRNISANLYHARLSPTPQGKATKLTPRKGPNPPLRLREETQIYEDVPDRTRHNGIAKENLDVGVRRLEERSGVRAATPGTSTNPLFTGQTSTLPGPSVSSRAMGPSKVTKKVGGGARKATGMKPKPRIGIRRL